MQLLIREEAHRQNARRTNIPSLNESATRLPLQSKVNGSELSQDIGLLAADIAGAHSTLSSADGNAPAGGKFPLAYMNSFGGTIAAGTSEIQRNILGERVLGLPKTK